MRRERKPEPGKIQTHDLLIIRRVLDRYAKTATFLKMDILQPLFVYCCHFVQKIILVVSKI